MAAAAAVGLAAVGVDGASWDDSESSWDETAYETVVQEDRRFGGVDDVGYEEDHVMNEW
jgi:hypothetical protein